VNERGVLGGSGIGCRGARGESGIPVRGDIGGEAKDCFGILGNGDPSGLSPGLGLIGRPGLIRGGEIRLLWVTIGPSKITGLSKALIEPAAGGRRGELGKPTLWTGLKPGVGGGSFIAFFSSIEEEPSAGGLLLLLLFFFFDLLRASWSFWTRASRIRSSSSRVFLLPLSNIGISSTSIISS
jgi:hypothetical protein